MPFFWRINGPSRNGVKSLEGIIDVAFFNQKANEVFILDWKTNRIAAGQIEILKETYRPQMAAYWQAICSLTNALVSAAIYSTATGEFLMYEPEELAREWERVRDLPHDGLAAAISSRAPRG
jgi:hypothetical protein